MTELNRFSIPKEYATLAPMENDTYRNWQHRLHEIIFEADTRAGKWFDILLIVSILTSILYLSLLVPGSQYLMTIRQGLPGLQPS